MMSLPVLLPGPMFLLGGLCPWSHVPSMGVSVWGSLSRGLCLGGSLLGGLCPGVSAYGVSVQGGLCPVVSVGRSPESEKQAGRILSECFLVL